MVDFAADPQRFKQEKYTKLKFVVDFHFPIKVNGENPLEICSVSNMLQILNLRFVDLKLIKKLYWKIMKLFVR